MAFELRQLQKFANFVAPLRTVFGLGTFFLDANRIDATTLIFSNNNANRIESTPWGK